MLLVHHKWSTETYWMFTYRNSISLENRTLQLQILLLLLLWVRKKKQFHYIWHPCLISVMWTSLQNSHTSYLNSSQCSFSEYVVQLFFLCKMIFPLLPQSTIVIKKNFAPWKTVGTIVYNESTKPSSAIPGEVNSCVTWPTLLHFFVWVLKVIYCNTWRNKR